MELLLILFNIFLLTVEGQQPYYFSTERCCNGTIHDISEYQNEYFISCCGNNLLMAKKIHLKSSKMCCGGKIINKAVFGCCNGEKYNPKTSTCLNGVIAIRIPAEDKAKGRTSACGQSADDAKFYNETEQLCCQGNVTERESSTYKCCGKLSYDYLNNKCCDGKIVPKEKGKEDCCGQSLYDKETHTCCVDKLYPLPPRGKMMTWSPSCCGSEFLNKSTHFCCSKDSLDYTGLRSFREYKMQPDDEENKNSAQCCGLDVIDTKTQACGPNEEILKKGDIVVRNCCGRKYQYDADAGKWSRVALTSDVADEEWCHQPGSKIYITVRTIEKCDRNKLSEYSLGGPTCYLHKDGLTVPYNETNQLCCRNRVIPKPDGISIYCCDIDPPPSPGE